MLHLQAEVDARRARLAGNLGDLGIRMQPRNLVAEAKEAAWMEVDRVTDEVIDIATDLVNDGLDWTKRHRKTVAGGALAGVLAGVALWYVTRKKPVPLYAAYDMEDPEMMNETDETIGDKAAHAWDRVKEEAHNLGGKAEGAYYAARSKATVLATEARERAADAAELARQRASEAADAAREAAEKAREAAGEAGRWARRQPQENPVTVVLVALAAGALIGALLPRGRRDA